MYECKLEDYEKYRVKLTSYASNLFRTRGFHNREGELKAHSEDVVQQAYIRFHKYGTDKYVSERHLENFLISLVYKEYLASIDINRKGGQYILYKVNPNGDFKEEFRQLNVTKYEKPTQEEFDCISSFKKHLDELDIKVVDLLLEGYSQKETAEKLKIPNTTLFDRVARIRKKYKEIKD